MSAGVDQHDGRRTRCRRLGHDVTFAYCRAPGVDVPCPSILNCWWEIFDVETFLRDRAPAALAAVKAHRPVPRLAGIAELAAEARRRAGQGSEG